MKIIKNDILSIVGVITASSFAFIADGVANPALTSLAAGLAANFVWRISPGKIKRWFVDVHPDNMNHHIKKLFVKSVNEALDNIYVLFCETNISDAEKKEAKQLIKALKKHLPQMFLNGNQIKLEEIEVKHFLYEKDKEDDICNFIKNEFDAFGITEPFKSFLAQNLPTQIQLCFGEGLKDPANQSAWIAFQRMLMEETRNNIKQIADTQQSIKDDLSDLRFEKSGFSTEQTAEIRQLINILNNKRLVEVKVKDGITQNLQSIEDKANQIIRLTTETNITVAQLRKIVEKLHRQNRINQIIIFSLVGCLFMMSGLAVYKLMNQPFTATIQIVDWKETFLPTLKLEISGKWEEKQIDKKGIAEFNKLSSKYNNEEVSIKITDTENMPYYLTDSVIRIYKDKISEIQVRLRGLESLEAKVCDFDTREVLLNAHVTCIDTTVITNEFGKFLIKIPLEKQQKEQRIIIEKDGYEYYDQFHSFVEKAKPAIFYLHKKK